MGTLPTFLAIFGFVFLWISISISTIRSKHSELHAALNRLKDLSEERLSLMSQFFKKNFSQEIGWKEMEEATSILKYQDQVLTKVDQEAISANLDDQGKSTFTKHLGESQQAINAFNQLVHSYNNLVTKRPNAFVATAFGYKPQK